MMQNNNDIKQNNRDHLVDPKTGYILAKYGSCILAKRDESASNKVPTKLQMSYFGNAITHFTKKIIDAARNTSNEKEKTQEQQTTTPSNTIRPNC